MEETVVMDRPMFGVARTAGMAVSQGLRVRFAAEAAATFACDAGITVADLTDRNCHFPIGDPSNLELFRYCGSPKSGLAAGSYCARHRALTHAVVA